MNMLARHAHLYTNDSKRGILCIENLHDGMVHLLISENMAKDIQAIRFRLDLGTFEHTASSRMHKSLLVWKYFPSGYW